MDPFSAVATVFSVGSAVMGAGAEYQQAKGDQYTAQENAKRAREAAGNIRLAGQQAEEAKRRELRMSLGRSAASISQAGIGGPGYGSAGARLKQSSREAEMDALNVRYAYESDAYGQELEALNQDAAAQAARRRARNAKTSGFVNAASAALNGYASYSGMRAQRDAMRPRATRTSSTKLTKPRAPVWAGGSRK